MVTTKKQLQENSLVVQWLGLCTLNAKILGSVPDQGTKIPQAVKCSRGKKKKLPKKQLQNTYKKGEFTCFTTKKKQNTKDTNKEQKSMKPLEEKQQNDISSSLPTITLTICCLQETDFRSKQVKSKRMDRQIFHVNSNQKRIVYYYQTNRLITFVNLKRQKRMSYRVLYDSYNN